jgi:hypothetical protein
LHGSPRADDPGFTASFGFLRRARQCAFPFSL